MSVSEAEKIFDKYTYMKNDSILKMLIDNGTIDSARASEIDMSLFKEREKQILELHKNAISEINYIDHGKEVIKYQTRASWVKSGKIRKNSYRELIDELHKHYCLEIVSIPTVDEAFHLWVEERKKFKSADTKTILHNCKEWERYYAGKKLSDIEIKQGKSQIERAEFLDMKVTDVKASHIVRHFRYIVGDGNVTRQKFTNIKTPLIGAFSYAISHDINCLDPRSINTTDIVKRCKPENDNHNKVYTKEMFATLREYLEGLKQQTTYTLAIRLCMNLGCRIGELRAIHWEDYDRVGRKLYLHRQMVDVETDKHNRVSVEKDYMKSRSKAGKRELPFTDAAIEILDELYFLNGDKTYILANQAGEKPITSNRFNENLKRACEACNLPYLSSHKIRFGVVTALYDAGVSEKVIQNWAGHSDITTTRHYDRRSRDINLSRDELNSIFA